MSRPLIDLVVVYGADEVETPSTLVSSSNPRALAVSAVALSPALVALLHDECPGESPYDLSVTVADTAHSEGLDFETIAEQPELAVAVVRELWTRLSRAVQ